MNANVLPLESFSLPVLPKTTHNITWSPDDELAIGCDDCVFVYVPDFSVLPAFNTARPTYEGPRQYDEAALRFPIAPLKNAELNRHLFDAAGQEFMGYTFFTGGGSGIVTGHGSTLNHTVSLAWSPCGLGRMNRSVLAVLTAAGILTVYCQGASEALGSAKVHGRDARTLRPWVPVWHVGGGFLLPTAKHLETTDKREYITAFAWAKDTRGGAAMLSYMNDDHEIVLLSVQSKHNSRAPPGNPGQWKVLEVARFAAPGPHIILDPTDPDYSYHGSSFALSWSPWFSRGSSKTSVLSYITHNHVGFRQITINEPEDGQDVVGVQVGRVDASGVCLHLSSDAFVVWEDKIWMRPGSSVCRGIIASPAKVHAFEIPFDYTSPLKRHTTDECNTTYPSEDDMKYLGNPITGLIIHPPSMTPNTTTPAYTLVRLSATHDNPTWHQTNLPQIKGLDDPFINKLRWATEITQTIEHQLPRALALRQQPTSDAKGSGQGDAAYPSDAEGELDSDMESESDYGEYDEQEEYGEDGEGTVTRNSKIFGIRGVDTEDQVHLNRIRIWGMTASPGGGTSAVFISQHSTLELERDTFAGLNCRVLFGSHPPRARSLSTAPAATDIDTDTTDANTMTTVAAAAEDSEADLDGGYTHGLSTEARAWEWMYGGGPPVPGFSSPAQTAGDDREALRDQFKIIAQRRMCIFCDSVLEPQGNVSRCSKGHVFENCANTGVPIVVPNVSNTCGVCGLKCLKSEELLNIAPHLQSIIDEDISEEHCGGCGGKFIN